jgi:hypothetical protein
MTKTTFVVEDGLHSLSLSLRFFFPLQKIRHGNCLVCLNGSYGPALYSLVNWAILLPYQQVSFFLNICQESEGTNV